jgi:hypothetical protein
MEPWLIEKIKEEQKRKEREERERPRLPLPQILPIPPCDAKWAVVEIAHDLKNRTDRL